MPKYIKCPRCELNWIKEELDLCDVCKAELKIGGIELLEEEDEAICPICHLNFLESGEKICSDCREKKLDKVAIAPFEDTEEITTVHVQEDGVEIISFDDVEREEEAWADDTDVPFDEEVFAIDDLDEDLIVGGLEGEDEEEEEEIISPVHDAVEDDFESVIEDLANANFLDDDEDEDEKIDADEEDI